jgi:hypothetical protein
VTDVTRPIESYVYAVGLAAAGTVKQSAAMIRIELDAFKRRRKRPPEIEFFFCTGRPLDNIYSSGCKQVHIIKVHE